MKKKFVITTVCAFVMFLACGFSCFAKNMPRISLSDSAIEVTHEDTKQKVELTVSNWSYQDPFSVKWEIEDPDVCSVQKVSQSGDTAVLEIKLQGTGSTVVKFWIEGFERKPKYLSVDAINYQREKIDGYSVRHYGFMTGDNGECARIEDLSVTGGKLRVDFTLIDKGHGNVEDANFYMRAEEEDGDPLDTVKVHVSGMEVGGCGYKMFFNIPNGAEILRLIDDDI